MKCKSSPLPLPLPLPILLFFFSFDFHSSFAETFFCFNSSFSFSLSLSLSLSFLFTLVTNSAGRQGENRGLLQKFGDAWSIFFPKRERSLESLSPRDSARSRLRMIIQADRSSVSSEVLSDMKQTIIRKLLPPPPSFFC